MQEVERQRSDELQPHGGSMASVGYGRVSVKTELNVSHTPMRAESVRLKQL
jgi:hypothetical protein